MPTIIVLRADLSTRELLFVHCEVYEDAAGIVALDIETGAEIELKGYEKRLAEMAIRGELAVIH